MSHGLKHVDCILHLARSLLKHYFFCTSVPAEAEKCYKGSRAPRVWSANSIGPLWAPCGELNSEYLDPRERQRAPGFEEASGAAASSSSSAAAAAGGWEDWQDWQDNWAWSPSEGWQWQG